MTATLTEVELPEEYCIGITWPHGQAPTLPAHTWDDYCEVRHPASGYQCTRYLSAEHGLFHEAGDGEKILARWRV